MSEAFILPDQAPIAFVLPTVRQTALIYAQTRQTAMVYAPMGMRSSERELLYALAEKAMQRESPISFWKQAGIDNALASDVAPGGNSNYITLTTGYQLLAQGVLPAHSVRDQGVIHARFLFSAMDTAAGEMGSISIEMRSRPDWPVSSTEPTATRGKVAAEVIHVDFASGKFDSKPASAHSRVVLELWITSEGHEGSTWPFTVSGLWHIEGDTSPIEVPVETFTNFDPTRDQLFEVWGKVLTLAGTSTTQLRGTHAWLYDFRPETGFEG